jgi:hypothetical protein
MRWVIALSLALAACAPGRSFSARAESPAEAAPVTSWDWQPPARVAVIGPTDDPPDTEAQGEDARWGTWGAALPEPSPVEPQEQWIFVESEADALAQAREREQQLLAEVKELRDALALDEPERDAGDDDTSDPCAFVYRLGRPCEREALEGSGLCALHERVGGRLCSAIAASTGERCRHWTQRPSGLCHQHAGQGGR